MESTKYYLGLDVGGTNMVAGVVDENHQIIAKEGNICGDFATAGSFNICAASEIVDIGVLNSCVMLLTKSFFISVNFFWRNTI